MFTCTQGSSLLGEILLQHEKCLRLRHSRTSFDCGAVTIPESYFYCTSIQFYHLVQCHLIIDLLLSLVISQMQVLKTIYKDLTGADVLLWMKQGRSQYIKISSV